VLVVIVGTLVEVHLEVYAVCVERVFCFQAIVVSIAEILSYTAFFVGACVVSEFQLLA
jgi:hypothetical protein